ncbi:MAG: AMP-binding protein, partial [bacterium]|nr:AMP-binding protein [bacterium]
MAPRQAPARAGGPAHRCCCGSGRPRNRRTWSRLTIPPRPSTLAKNDPLLRDRVLQKTSFTFDVSVWEFFWPLMTGSALILARPDGHRDAGYLAQLIAREEVTTLHFVPSMLRIFL